MSDELMKQLNDDICNMISGEIYDDDLIEKYRSVDIRRIGEFILDEQYDLEVRANAILMFFTILGAVFSRDTDDKEIKELALKFVKHENPLIRLGALYGLEEVGDIEGMKLFLHETIPAFKKVLEGFNR